MSNRQQLGSVMTVNWRLLATTGLALVLGAVGPAAAQFMALPSDQDTITVTASGSAQLPAEWFEVQIPVQGDGETADAAMMMVNDHRDRAIVALVDAGFKQESIRSEGPTLTGMNFMRLAQGQGKDAAKWSVTDTVIVRVDDAKPDEMYELVAQILDAASGVVKPEAAMSGGVAAMMGSSELVRFGVKNDRALRRSAIENALDQAREIAGIAATAAGKELGGLLGLQMVDTSGEGMLAMMRMFNAPAKPGVAQSQITLTATFKIE